ncbi:MULTISPECIES: hypothetical protein [Serratia]|uniref:hypothetical protein n=1 Tax=Serratia TaxID=613 RepID=UPI00080FD9AC|nr:MULTISPECIES: hypothetical protein [Serratia]OCJ37364.1 hypothetical protein A6U95_24970 [Serratia sp. 14-2641]QXN65264.1 hypothetical protein J8M99_26250 [Serratia fonticola]
MNATTIQKPVFNATPDSHRKTCMVIYCVIKGTPSIHFCSSPLSGADSNLWIAINPASSSVSPVGQKVERSDLHAAIEQIMTINNMAHNVVRVEEVLRRKEYVDYCVTYNALSRS